MQIVIMDSDYEVMKKLESLINGYPNHSAKCYTTLQLLVDAVQRTLPDIVLVDVDLSGSSSAVRLVQSSSPNTKIIIMSEEKGKASEYFRLHADGFLLKPFAEEKLKEQLLRVNHPLLARIKYGNEGRKSV